MIRASGLHKAFDGKPVLTGVDVSVPRGRLLGVVGPGGGGKSLLLKLLCRLVPADAGQVSVDGTDVTALPERELGPVRRRIGMLFQNYALFDFMTVGENVAFPLEQAGGIPAAEIADRVAQRLAEVELPGTEATYPNELSGGMKKRVALARATIANAPILLYDDPTAGLDPVTSSKIFELIARLHGPSGATVVVSHDIDRLRDICDHWLLLHEGRVWFRGTTEEAAASNDPVVRTFFEPPELGP